MEPLGRMFLVSCQDSGVVGKGVFLVWERFFAFESYHSQVRFYFWFSRWRPVFVGGTGCGGVAANFVGLRSLVFYYGTIGDSNTESNVYIYININIYIYI